MRPLSVSGEWCWPIREGGVAFRLRGTPRRGLAARARARSHTHTHTHTRRVCERPRKCRAVMPNCVPLVAGGGPPAKRGLQVLCKSSPHTRTRTHTHTQGESAAGTQGNPSGSLGDGSGKVCERLSLGSLQGAQQAGSWFPTGRPAEKVCKFLRSGSRVIPQKPRGSFVRRLSMCRVHPQVPTVFVPGGTCPGYLSMECGV